MTENKLCTICFTKPALYLRQCLCIYCKECIANTSSECKCGGTGGLIEITNDIKDQLLNYSDDNRLLVWKLYNDLTNYKDQAISQFIEKLESIERIKMHQCMMKTKFLLKKLMDLEEELNRLRRENNLKEENFRQDFDFEPFEEMLKKKNIRT